MQLPSHLQHFPKPTLLVLADNIDAICYLLLEDKLTTLKKISEPRERRQDHEGSYATSGNSRIGSPDSDIDDGPREHTFVEKMKDEIVKLSAEYNVHAIHLIMPPKIEHALSAVIPNNLLEKLGQRLHLDLMYSTPLDAVERLLAD